MVLQLLLILLIINYIIAFCFILKKRWRLKDCIFLLLPYMAIIICITAISFRVIIDIIDFINDTMNKEK